MKVESGRFSPNSATTIATLADPTLQVKAIYFQCTSTGSTISQCTGFDDGVNPHVQWSIDNGSVRDSNRSGSNSVILKSISSGSVVNAQVGYVTSLATAGEFSMSWSYYNGTPVDFLVIGD